MHRPCVTDFIDLTTYTYRAQGYEMETNTRLYVSLFFCITVDTMLARCMLSFCVRPSVRPTVRSSVLYKNS